MQLRYRDPPLIPAKFFVKVEFSTITFTSFEYIAPSSVVQMLIKELLVTANFFEIGEFGTEVKYIAVPAKPPRSKKLELLMAAFESKAYRAIPFNFELFAFLKVEFYINISDS